MNPLVYLQVALALFTVALVVAWIKYRRPDPDDRGLPTPGHLAVGFGTNFFDTLGIGSFAPTTALFRLFRMVPDERIPGTLNVGHTLPTIAQAFIFTQLVEVEFRTLVIMIAASILGAWLGAGVVARWPRRKIQIGMGVALLVAAFLFTLTNLKIIAGGGEALGLTGAKLIIAVVGNFGLGALMTLGIGLYGPSLIMISLLGMNPRAAFPIMMGSCAFLMVVAAIRFIRERAYRERPSLGLTLAGVPAVLIAALIVKALPLTAIRWLVAVVVLYTAVTMLRSAVRERGLDG
jgi:uncharacterized membrane protein YfcA